ncbi:MAG: ACT domain-containing protein [Dehalococcoidia bacterium]|nr:ACT domain-containing protein [Dehalococcoidia bacterium]
MGEANRRLHLLPGVYAVCRLDEDAPVPDWSTRSCFYSITRTEQGLTVVCPADHVPREVAHEGGWSLLMVEGPLAFSLTGIIASLTGPLSRARISVFALSTYDTDYLLVKQEQLENAVRVLVAEGFEVDA